MVSIFNEIIIIFNIYIVYIEKIFIIYNWFFIYIYDLIFKEKTTKQGKLLYNY